MRWPGPGGGGEEGKYEQKIEFSEGWLVQTKDPSAVGWGIGIFLNTITGHTVATNSVLEIGTESNKVTYFIPL